MHSGSRVGGPGTLGVLGCGVLMLVVGLVTGSAGGYVVAAVLFLTGGALLCGAKLS
jgi:hypothetical protein